MKSIEVLYKQNNFKFFEDFSAVFLEDIQNRLQGDCTDQVLYELVCQCIDEMTYTKNLCERKKADVKIIRIEMEVLDSGAIKFTYVPLDDDHLPVLIREECPMMVIAPSREDIEREAKTKKLNFFILKKGILPEN